MISAHPLVQLASDRSRAAREALVSATADQFLDAIGPVNAQERALYSDILVKLYSFARQEIRQLVAHLKLPVDEVSRKRAHDRKLWLGAPARKIILPDIFV